MSEHTAENAAVREAVAEMVRDHVMPPNKDQHGYDYRMGWWDAVTYLDSLVKRRVREARVIPPGSTDARPTREDGSLTRGMAFGVVLSAPLWALIVWAVAQIPPLTLGAVAACLAAAALAFVALRWSDARWERQRQALMAEEAARLTVARWWV